MLRGLLFVVGVLAAGPAQAETVTLSSLRGRALARRPELAAGRSRTEQGAAQLDEVQAARRPRFNVNAELTVSPGSELVEIQVDEDGNVDPPEGVETEPLLVSGSRPLSTGGSSFRPILRYRASAGAAWNVYDFGRTKAAERAAELELVARRATEAATAEELTEAVDVAYLDWLAASERARLQRSATERLMDRQRGLQLQVDSGAADESDLWPVRTELAAQRLRQAEAEGFAAESKLAVETAVGESLSESAQPDASLLDLAAAFSGTPEADPGVQALELRAQAAKSRAQRERRSRNPQLTATAEAGVRGQTGSLFPTYIGGLSFSIPFSDGGASAARARAAESEAEALRHQREQLDTEERRARDRDRLMLEQAQRRVTLAREYLRLAERRLEDARSRDDGSQELQDQRRQARSEHERALLAHMSARLDRTYAALRLGVPPG